MRTQRAIRRLKPDPVDDALVLRLIELALKAPTASNAQNWEFVMVKDRASRSGSAAQPRCFRIYGGLGAGWRAASPACCASSRRAVAGNHFADIPVVIVACLRGFRVPFPPVAATSYYGSIYPSVQNLLLAARAAGLGPRSSRCRCGARSSRAARSAPVDRHALRRRAARVAARPLRPTTRRPSARWYTSTATGTSRSGTR